MESKSNKPTFWNAITEPWSVIYKNKLIFFVWFMFSLLASQIGTIINLILRVVFGNLTLVQSIYLESQSGSFYTFAIVLLASLLSPLFMNFVEDNPTHFKSIKIVLITVLIFTLFFAGIFYATSSAKSNYNEEMLLSLSYYLDGWQFFFFLIAIVLAIYAFCVSRLDAKRNANLNDENYEEQDTKSRDVLSDSAIRSTSDNNGNKL